jgi:hypothetical protein
MKPRPMRHRDAVTDALGDIAVDMMLGLDKPRALLAYPQPPHRVHFTSRFENSNHWKRLRTIATFFSLTNAR